MRQTTVPSEIIIVDDSPDDSVLSVCREHEPFFEEKGTHIIYAKNVKERSNAIARNVGVQMAKGEIVLFLDDDVVLDRDYIAKTLVVFETFPESLGVQGWIRTERPKFHSLFAGINKAFLLGQATINTCRLFEYPAVLTKIVNCEALCGCDMALKRSVFQEFKFDESLKEYSNMEDDLLSYSIFKRYPRSLFITPYARCVHKHSSIARAHDKASEKMKDTYRRYVLVRLFGMKGAFLFFWQMLGKTLTEVLLHVARLVRGRQVLENGSERQACNLLG
jgi:GT2 family glycosyltransferase